MFIFLYKYISVILVRKRKPFIGWSSTFQELPQIAPEFLFAMSGQLQGVQQVMEEAGSQWRLISCPASFMDRWSLVWERAKGFRLKAHLHQCHRTSHESTRESAPKPPFWRGWLGQVSTLFRSLTSWPHGKSNRGEHKEAKKRQKESASQSAHTSKAGYDTSSWRLGTIPK